MEKGIVHDQEVINVKLAGVGNGMQMTVSGKGSCSPVCGVNGDLLVVFEEEEHGDLIRDGNYLFIIFILSFPDAALGAAIEAPTVESKVKINIDRVI